jgi:hypothetical protein
MEEERSEWLLLQEVAGKWKLDGGGTGFVIVTGTAFSFQLGRWSRSIKTLKLPVPHLWQVYN